MRQHPSEEILRRYLTEKLSSEEARRIEQHLSLCSECRDQTDAISSQLALELLDSWLRPGYDEAFERAADRTAECLASLLEESRNTEDLLAELLREPAPLRRRRIADGERFHSLKLGVEVALHMESGRYGSSPPPLHLPIPRPQKLIH